MTAPKRLFRRSSSGRIAGVCAGIAEYLDADVTLVRLLWIILSIVPGGLLGGLVAYLVAWIAMPDATGPAAGVDARRLTRSITERTERRESDAGVATEGQHLALLCALEHALRVLHEVDTRKIPREADAMRASDLPRVDVARADMSTLPARTNPSRTSSVSSMGVPRSGSCIK